MLSLEGKQLGNYDVIKRIRVGGMGAVYEGRQRTAFDRRVAIKVILGDYAADRDMRRRFAREARTIARLQHPHILPLIEFGDEAGILYLVMPFIDGGTLTSYLRRNLPDLEEVASIYNQLLDAVEYAHEQGLIHRDIKSSNVLLEMRRSGPPHIYLADFGLVRTMHPDAAKQPGKPIPLDQVPGTPHYMAPEQTRGIVTTQTDIYALGVILYQLLVGNLPYNDPDEIRVIQMHLHSPIPIPSEADGSLLRELDAVVRRAMAKRPEERYATVSELRTAFKRALDGPGIETLPDEDEAFFSDVVELSPPVVPRPRRTGAFPPAPRPAREHPVETEKPEPPSPQPRRLARTEGAPVTLRDARERARNTDSVQDSPVRITEEPVPLRRRQRRLILPVALSMLVTVLLLGLILVPRVLGVNVFPPGWLPGSSNIATITIQVQQKSESNTFVLVASSKVKQTDLEKRTIPSRSLSDKVSSPKSVNTTGQRTIQGTAAMGNAIFTNPTVLDVLINPDAVFVANNIRFHLIQPLLVPARQGGHDGQQTGQLEALDIGQAGNIGPHALDGNKCCNDAILVSNLEAFSGGKDPRTVKTVAEADITSAKQALKNELQDQVKQRLQKKLQRDEVMAGSPVYNISASSDISVGQDADKVNVTVSVEGTVTVYNRATAEDAARNLLLNQAKRDFGEEYTLYKLQDQVSVVSILPSSKQGTGKNEPVYLNVTVHGQWLYTISDEQLKQWRNAIKNTGKDVAVTYLKSRPGVAGVTIQLPIGSEQLPGSINDIKIEIQASKSS